LDADPANRPHFAFPARVTISDARQAEAVAKAICALPLMLGKRYCPNDNGVSYRIAFTGHSGASVVNIQASGCREVRGLGPVRWALTKPAFWDVLGTAMGLRDAANSTFTGQIGTAQTAIVQVFAILPQPVVADGASALVVASPGACLVAWRESDQDSW
jgi:hypothetical protein